MNQIAAAYTHAQTDSSITRSIRSPTTMQFIVNGQVQQAGMHTTVAELVLEVSDRQSGIAVALNGEVVPRSTWSDVMVRDGDRVDVVTAVQGG
jgi:sulfur carrier protein